MNKTLSAIAVVSVFAGMFYGTAITASAAEQELTYNDASGAALNTYTYSSNSNDAYTLSEESKIALNDAKAGDTLVIKYDLISDAKSQLRWRSGFNIAGKQLYVNGYTQTTKGNWNDKNNYHINTDLVDNETATVTYTITLADGGSASNIYASVECGGTTAGDSITLNNADITSFMLNTQDRGSSLPEGAMTLQNFSAVLTTADTEPEIIPAEKYNYTNDPTLAEADATGFVATINGLTDQSVNSLTWYLKKTGTEYKELANGSIPTVSGAGTVKIGLIVYDLPEGVTGDDISAGYTYTSAAAATE